MTANELMIGNYLFKHGEVVKIVEIGIKHKGDTNYYLRSENDNCGYWIDQFKPIPLTEEILLKCGFEKREDGDYNLFKYSEVDIIICNDFSSWQCDGINFSVNCIKYLHQLQNLYWCLLEEELNVNI